MVFDVRGLNFFYGSHQALFDVSMPIYDKKVTALIGPSGCGKSTFLRCLNRMNDTIAGTRVDGAVELGNTDLYKNNIDVVALRKQVGMVFQKSNPFPKSIYDNVAYGPRIHGERNRATLDALVETSLKQAGLWNEVKDRLKSNALGLSGGQQQRLCIARALAVEPVVLLMDEPTSALDPIATGVIEELMNELKQRYTVVIVTHNMQQAARISDFTAFFYQGHLIEFSPTGRLFTNPAEERTRDYIQGRFG